MKKLHPKQEKLLEVLSTSIEPLTIRDLQKELNISSTSVVFHHLNQLKKKGYLKKSPKQIAQELIRILSKEPIEFAHEVMDYLEYYYYGIKQ